MNLDEEKINLLLREFQYLGESNASTKEQLREFNQLNQSTDSSDKLSIEHDFRCDFEAGQCIAK